MISIIVPCRNGGRWLSPLLDSLVSQEVAEAAEIVVVDNGSTDGSADVAASVRGRIPVRVVAATGRANASYARNVGVRATSGDKLMFVDADDEVMPGYVKAMSAALDDHGFVTSRVDSEALNPAWVRAAHGPPWQAKCVTIFFDFLPGTGVNIGVRRSLFDRIGGFPEQFTGSQDVVFAWSAQLAGAHLHFVPDAVYRYRYRSSLGGLFRQTRNWGISNVLLYRHFRPHGMTRRPLRDARRDWVGSIAALLRARTRAEAAPAIVTLGYCVGRLMGSVRFRTFYP